MAAGLLLGRAVPGLSEWLSSMEVGSISIPIAIGLLVMMYPPLAKVRYDKVRGIVADKRLMAVSLVLNWLVGPALMFALAWIFLPVVSPLALIGLLYTIVLLFALQGEHITSRPGTVARLALPLLGYFVVMFFVGIFASRAAGLDYERSSSVAFTAAGNNFELAIAVAIGTFGVTSGQALAGTIGPLIEVPVLVALVYVALWLRPRLFSSDAPSSPTHSN